LQRPINKFEAAVNVVDDMRHACHDRLQSNRVTAGVRKAIIGRGGQGAHGMPITHPNYHRISTAALLFFAIAGFVMAGTQPASAVDPAVRSACTSDYFAHCSRHPVGSPAVDACMRAAGPKLSRRCVDALVKAGEVSRAEVKRRADAR
jgi:hypothetical protein